MAMKGVLMTRTFIKRAIQKYRGFTIYGFDSNRQPNYLIVETGEWFWQLKQAKKRIDEVLEKEEK